MNPWEAWRRFVQSILYSGRELTPEERAHAEALVKEAKAAERRERRRQKRLAAGREWVE